MFWHYLIDGRSSGPVNDEVFQTLRRDGRIHERTWVWREGMPDWCPLGQIELPPEHEEGPALGACSMCGRLIPVARLLAFDRAWVCGDCKPTFLTRLKEGFTVAGEFAYGGFWIRGLALLIDWILLATLSGMVLLPAIYMSSLNDRMGIMILGYAILTLLPYVIKAVYEIIMVGRYGATLGKMVCGLRIAKPNGEPISYARSAGRHFAKYISSFTVIGYILAAVGEEKKSLHDMICDTRVIRS